jgi:mycothiol synthase
MAAQYPLTAPRPYRGKKDLDRMRAILVNGRQAGNGTYYIHLGDLDWWLYYLPHQMDPWQNIFLWESEDLPDALLGWTLLSPDWRAFDVFVHPDQQHTPLVEQMFHWSEERLAQLIRAHSGEEIRTMWIAEQDAWLRATLIQHGFTVDSAYILCLQHNLDASTPKLEIPRGYHLRSLLGEPDLENRAAVQYEVFGSKIPFEEYQQCYLHFMRSPAYDPHLDLVIESADGQFVAFCIIWLDPINQVGYFEPVGVHPDHQRKGLGKALMSEGLRRMQLAGMAVAQVCVEHDNLAGQGLYETTGFTMINKLMTYFKPVNPEAG